MSRDNIARGLAVAAQGSAPLLQSGAAVSHTGDLVETTTDTATVAANSVGTNGALRVVAMFTFSGTAAGKTVKAKLGGTTVATFGVPATAASYRIDVIIGAANATGSQVVNGVGISSTGSFTAVAGTSSIDMTQAQTLTITEQLGNAADSISRVFAQVVPLSHS